MSNQVLVFSDDKLIKHMWKSINASHFTKCECSGHMLEVERFINIWQKDNTKDEGFNIAVWEMVHRSNSMGWHERIRWCWHILTKGSAWTDSIIVSNNNARKIAEFIIQNLPKEEINEEDSKK